MSADGWSGSPSILIHPIRVGGQTIGAVLCSYRRGPIFVFRERDDEGVGLIADMLGNHWLHRQRHVMFHRNRQVQERASKALAKFSQWVSQSLQDGDVPDDQACMSKALEAVATVADVKDFHSIRMPCQTGSRRFVFGPTRGPLWTEDEDVRRKCQEMVYDLVQSDNPDDATSAAEYVLNKGTAVIVDARRPPSWFWDTFLDHFDMAIFVPVFRGGDRGNWAGVIDVRFRRADPFAPALDGALMPMAEQLGMTLALLDRQRELRQAREGQLAVFQDLKHQISGPHRTALRQIERAQAQLLRMPVDQAARVRGYLTVTAAQTRRAMRVGASAGHFADLHREGRISHRPLYVSDLYPSTLAETINKIFYDQKALSEPARELIFNFDRESFVAAAPKNFYLRGEVGLFEQLIAALVENAQKYSFRGKEIKIAGATEEGSVFVIDVGNTGYDIDPDDVPRLRQRGERGKEAPIRVANGQGIGLWLADAIVASFGGQLEIRPGSRQAPHHFRLAFPIRQKEE